MLWLTWLSPLLLAWVLGTGLQLCQAELGTYASYLWPVIGSCLLSLFTLWVWRKVATQSRWHQSVALLICACAMSTVAALAFASVAWRAKAFQKDELPASLQGLDLDVTGKVMGLPQRQADGWRFRFQISEAFRQGSQTPLALPQQLQLGWYANESTDAHALPTLQVGQRWRLPLRLKQPHGLVNPGGFDMELWLWEQGIHATGYVRTGANSFAPVLLDHAFVWWDIEAWRQAARDRIQTRVNEPRWAAVVSALLLGDQAGVDRADWEVFRATGVAHLMSISGLHITLWACVARWLIAWCWRRSDLWGRSWCLWIPAPHAAHWGGLLMAWAYALFSGWGVPSQRTVAMLASVCVLHSQAVRWPLHTQWLLAMVVVVVLDPWALLQAGFWLSFVAVAMLFMGQPAKAIPAPDAWKISTTAVDKYMAAWQHLCALCKEQWLISICLAPLCVVLFQQVSVVGLLANLFAIPWVTWVVTPLAFAGLVWTPFWQASAWAAQSLCSVLEPMAHWSWAVWHTAAPPWWLALIGMAGAVMWAFARKKVPRFLGLLLIVPCLCWLPDRPSTGTVEVLAADIGQGNAVLVRTATHSLLFDTGPRYGSDSDAGERVWLPLLQRMAERLDLLILSHQDADHTGGALSVHAAQPQAEILSSITASHWLGQSLTMQRCEAGQRWQWDSVTLEVLHPLASDYQQNLTPNARSCVLRIHAQDQTVLLTADIEAFQEQALVERLGEKLHADVLLVPHHGSKTSSTEVFLKTVNPRMAWVQAGYRNRYGHPAPAVMSRYAAQGVPVWDSPHCGAMHWRSDAPMQVDCERDRQRRYWHHRLP